MLDAPPAHGFTPLGNEWTRKVFDGPFYVRESAGALPVTSLVFVQSRDGNTGADDPGTLGGGDTDKHLIYEGLSRVLADAVRAMRALRARGIAVVSAVGGRRTARWLLRAGVVHDLYLTTSARSAGEPDTPLHDGPPLSSEIVLEKRGRGRDEGVRFEHLLVGADGDDGGNGSTQRNRATE